MNAGQYKISLNKINRLLRKYSLTKEIPSSLGMKNVPTEDPDIESYASTYQKAIDSFTYDLLLFDESFLKFSRSSDPKGQPEVIRYAYCQCPYEFISYEEYLESNGFFYIEVGEAFRGDYEQDLSEAPLRELFNYIRYDYSGQGYQVGIHPASHLHIGLTGSIRIPIEMVITPYMFSLFVLKQCYYDRWSVLMMDAAFWGSVQTSKVSCSPLNIEGFADLDRTELYLV